MPWFLAIAAVAVTGFVIHDANRRAAARFARERALLEPFRAAMQPAAALLGVRMPKLVLLWGRDDNATTWPDRIGVSRPWLESVVRRHCDDVHCAGSILVGVAAHELAHYVMRDPGNTAVPPPVSRAIELRADFVAGWMLARLGLDAGHFGRVLQELATTCDTHPTWPSRVDALHMGYRHSAWELHETVQRHEPWFLREGAGCRPVGWGW